MILMNKDLHSQNLLNDVFTTIQKKYDDGEIRVKHIQRTESKDGKEVTYSIATAKVEPEITDFQLSAKIQKYALDINHGLTYPLESLDRLIELGEAAKKFKEEN